MKAMLNMTKSADKSALEEAKRTTTVAIQQCDEVQIFYNFLSNSWLTVWMSHPIIVGQVAWNNKVYYRRLFNKTHKLYSHIQR